MSTRWEELIAASAGTYRLDIHEVGAVTRLSHDADTVGETASVIKILILLSLLDAAQHKRLSLRKRLHLTRTAVGKGGSGLLQSMYLNTPFTIYNLAVLMIAVSDNAATTALIELIGFNEINAYAASLGLIHTRLIMKRLDFPATYRFTPKNRLGESTAAEMSELLEMLLSGKLLDRTHTRIAGRILARTLNTTFGRRLPMEQISHFGHKTGYIAVDSQPYALVGEAGFITTKSGHTYIFCMFACLPHEGLLRYAQDSPGRIEFAQVATALFDGIQKAGHPAA